MITRISNARLTFMAVGGVLLSGCGGAADNPQMVEEFSKQCKESLVAEVGSAELADQVCDYSTRKVKEQDLGPMDMLDREKMESIGAECAQEVFGGGSEAPPPETPQSE